MSKAQPAPLLVEIQIERDLKGDPTGGWINKDPVYLIHHSKPGEPHAIVFAVAGLLPHETVLIHSQQQGKAMLPKEFIGATLIPWLAPPGPYVLDHMNDRTQPLRSPLGAGDPDGDYAWNFEVILQRPGHPDLVLDPWTVVRKP